MRTALITTTIAVPTVLELYRHHGPDVAFFVALDQKSVPPTILALDRNTHFLTSDDQTKWKCSESIGWNCIQRRNIALLEAVKHGADFIVSVDDDNIPIGDDYFCGMEYRFGHADGRVPRNHFRGAKVSGANGWFDVGRLLDPVSPHRGFPIARRGGLFRADPVVGARIGVAAGICLGDPDISASTRIELRPEVHRVSELLQSGIVVDPSTWTVFNSQNTAIIRELAPAFFMLPGVGRHDDIYASLIMQRVMRHRGLHVHFGRPFVWQQRNAHDLIKDLRGEIDGMERIEEFAAALDQIELSNGNVVKQVRHIWKDLRIFCQWMPLKTFEAAFAFLDDMETVL